MIYHLFCSLHSITFYPVSKAYFKMPVCSINGQRSILQNYQLHNVKNAPSNDAITEILDVIWTHPAVTL